MRARFDISAIHHLSLSLIIKVKLNFISMVPTQNDGLVLIISATQLLMLQSAGVHARVPWVRPESDNLIITQFNNGQTFTHVLNIVFLIIQSLVLILFINIVSVFTLCLLFIYMKNSLYNYVMENILVSFRLLSSTYVLILEASIINRYAEITDHL